MTLPAGARLGPYEILAPLGAGGMGEVYKARDTRLERSVAVKVLSSHKTPSPETRQRFEREAKTISQLSHPHICALYDVGREGETEYLVMELLEGETLSERLSRGAIPLVQTLQYGTQIADALDKAHRQGFVHRDLKPANVMLTKSGVKLLDFGLAKAVTPAAPRGALTSLPTQQGLTQEGAILGTFQYMAPEQLEGKEADARTDIFAFGAVLHEMATGKKAFSGSSQASLISSIMTAEPSPISKVQPLSPPALDRIVGTCLAKDPEERWQSAADVKRELRWIAEGSQAGLESAAPAHAPRRTGERIAWGVAAVAVLAALAAGAALIRSTGRAGVPAPAMRSSILLPEKSGVRSMALSPDGRRLVVVAADSSGSNQLWIRPIDSLAVEPIPGTDNPSFPFWSPDGRSIGFFADGKLKRIDAAGGPTQTLCDAPISRGGSWSKDGVILFAPHPDGLLYRVSASGGQTTKVTRFNATRGETSHRWPFFLPDGRRFLYLVTSFGSGEERGKMGIYAGSLDSQEETFLVPAKSPVAYAQGFLLFLRERNLLAQPFDESRLKVSGDPFPLAERIQYFPQTANALLSVSATGLLLYQTGSASVLSQLTWLDRNGREIGSVGAPADQANPRISPDGRRIALDITDPQTGNMDVWIYPSEGGAATRVTFDAALEGAPVWAPNGDRIAFMAVQRGPTYLYEKSSSGAGTAKPLLRGELEGQKYATDWSADGRFLLYRTHDATSIQLWAVPLEGDRKPYPFLKTTFGTSHGQFSPDGKWVAYASNESGKWEIFVAPFPGPGGNSRVSSAGGSEPRWRRDGKELFYLSPDGKMMAVDVKPGATFEAGVARPLFQTHRRIHVSSTDQFSYDVSADGQRFLVSNDVGGSTSPQLTAVLHWTAGLKQ